MMSSKNQPTKPESRDELKKFPKIDFRSWKEHKRNSEQIYRAVISDKIPNPEVLAYFHNLMEIEAKYIKFVSKDLFKFPQLRILTFYDCKISEIPAEIGFLHDLEVLKFDTCEIFLEKKEIPRSWWDKMLGKFKSPVYEPESSLLNLCNLLNLKELYFINRPIYEFPEDISKLENLESLGFIRTRLISLPQNLQVLSHLKSIDVSNNEEANYQQITEVLSNCRFLEEVKINDLRNQERGFLDITFLRDLERLKTFSARNTFVKNVEVLSSFAQMEKIDLSRPSVDYYHKGIIVPAEFGNLIHLRELNLTGNKNPQLLAKVAHKIPQWQQLERLDLSNCDLKQIPEEIGDLINLRSLNLSENEFSELPHTFDYLANLNTLNLKGTKIHPKYINRLRELKPKLNIVLD